MDQEFFDEPLEQSKIKGNIATEYFPAWANIILKSRAKKVGFVDLYSGPGRYKDGTDSTPLSLLKKVIESEKLSNSLCCLFNDKTKSFIQELKENVGSITKADTLYYSPRFLNSEVSDDIVSKLFDFSNFPTIFFLDPWGYKGLSLKLIKFAVEPWGSECLFFFNYNRINPAITNPSVRESMTAIFGDKRYMHLEKLVGNMSPYEREVTIMNALCEALQGMGGQYVLPFCFKDAAKDKTSHYLVFAGKHARGYQLMKEIMCKYSEKDEDGVPSFTFDPKPQVQLEFTFNRPLRELKESLIQDFSGQHIKFEKLHAVHHVKTRFVWNNYRKALLELEEEGIVKVDKPQEKRVRKGEVTLSKDRIITFPQR